MFKLYRDPQQPTYWFAHSERTGWLRFPPKFYGWDERKPSSAPRVAFEVPLHMAFNTGLLEAKLDRRYSRAA